MSKRNGASKEFNPTLADVNTPREQQQIVDPEKGPQNKKRKKVD